MNKKILVLSCLIAVFSGCFAGRDYQKTLNSLLTKDLVTTGKDYQVVLNSWIGYDIDLLMRRWGNPTAIVPARSGTSVYVFGKTDNRSQPFRVYKHIFKALPDGTYTNTFKSKDGFSALPEYISLIRRGSAGNEVFRLSCETLFEVDKTDSIIHWSYRGYDCY